MNDGINLTNRVALIVGGSGALGQGISLKLASFGANIAITYCSNEEQAHTTANRIREMGRQAKLVQADITKATDVMRMVSAVSGEFGTIDILVNSAGIAPTSLPVAELEETVWNRVISVNLTGPFLCCKMVAPLMIKQQRGRIINISSIFGKSSPALRGPYGASKHGLIGLTQTLAKELGSYNITVNAICPGPVETPLLSKIWAKTAEQIGVTFENYYKSKTLEIPLGRLADTSEVGDLVVFLSSDMSNYISGAVIDIAGAAM